MLGNSLLQHGTFDIVPGSFQQTVVPRQGERHVDEWMAKHCELHRTEKFEGAVPAFLKFKEQFRGASGRVYLGFDGFHFSQPIVLMSSPG